VVPGRKLAPGATPVEALLADYRAWLVAERGLAASSVRCYASQAKTFLTQLADPLGESLARLDAAAVTGFVVGHSTAADSVWSAKALVTAMRSLLRFLHLEGLIPVPLTAAVPAVAGWRLAALPRGLQPGQVKALLAGCDTTTAVGLRDHAVLTVLASLGLRGAEVAALGLDDVDWRAGELVVRGKGSRLERPPLPVEVGAALAAYLTGGRPRCGCATLLSPPERPTSHCRGPRSGRSWVVPAGGRACPARRAPAAAHPGHRPVAGRSAPG
jgi:integrase/recombinase XerD